MTVRADRYTADVYGRLSLEQRAAIESAIPEGYRLHLTHGGRLYRARVLREDGELVDLAEAPRIELACERVLARVAA